MITHGAIGGITNLALNLLQTGDEVIFPEPIYPSYYNIIKFSKAIPVFVRAFREQEGKWIFDLEAIKKAVKPHTKMLIFANPSNPCGTYLHADELYELSNWCAHNGIYLLADEVYTHRT